MRSFFLNLLAVATAEQISNHGFKRHVHLSPDKSSSHSAHAHSTPKVRRARQLRQDDANTIQICLFSDRLDAMPTAMRSITQNTAENLHFWIITDHKAVDEMRLYFDNSDVKKSLDHTAVDVLDIDVVSQKLHQAGHTPLWMYHLTHITHKHKRKK